MVTLSPAAQEELQKFFETNPKKPVRIYVIHGGCSGLMLVLALDDPNEEDEVEEKAGITFCMQKNLKEAVRNVTIDVGAMGFTCTPEVPLPNAGGGCASCKSGSCGTCH